MHEFEQRQKDRLVRVVDDRGLALVGREQVGLQGSQMEDKVRFL
jgi:hypothetical protein